jgi:diguanylate cyclase (GGDEF)-like protein
LAYQQRRRNTADDVKDQCRLPDTASMKRLRRMAPVLASVTLVLATGAFGIALSDHANTQAEGVLRADRTSLQTTLAGLGKQYVLFSLKEGLDYSSTGTWSLRPGAPADAARLHSFVDHAVLLNYAAALVNLQGQPLNAYAAGPGVPPPTDPGYGPMKRALLAGKPDVSSVMHVGSIPVVAMAVPITIGGQVRALFVGYVRLDRSALETYVEHLRYGKTGQTYVVDSTGIVVASTNPADIGHMMGQPRAIHDLRRGATGILDDGHSDSTVAFAPLDIGGWGGLITQNTGEFFGTLQSGHLLIELGIVGLLAVASAIILLMGYKRDAARRRYQEQLAHLAYHDGLTGLANRSLFHDRLSQALARAKRHTRTVAVLYLDLDAFKLVNDEQGHDAGDTVLVEVGRRLRNVVRAEDTVARMGGDEFAVVMEEVEGLPSVTALAARIVEELGEPMTVQDREVVVTASVGIAYSENGLTDVESLLRDADLAMYRAKAAGKNCFVNSSESLVTTTDDVLHSGEPIAS